MGWEESRCFVTVMEPELLLLYSVKDIVVTIAMNHWQVTSVQAEGMRRAGTTGEALH